MVAHGDTIAHEEHTWKRWIFIVRCEMGRGFWTCWRHCRANPEQLNLKLEAGIRWDYSASSCHPIRQG